MRYTSCIRSCKQGDIEKNALSKRHANATGASVGAGRVLQVACGSCTILSAREWGNSLHLLIPGPNTGHAAAAAAAAQFAHAGNTGMLVGSSEVT
eukprot:1154963-Pelagomonas_calceolata.AAC.4